MGRHVNEETPVDEPYDPDEARDAAVGNPPTSEADTDDQPPRTTGLGAESFRRNREDR